MPFGGVDMLTEFFFLQEFEATLESLTIKQKQSVINQIRENFGFEESEEYRLWRQDFQREAG